MGKPFRAAVSCAVIVALAVAQRGLGQDVFTLGFDGPLFLAGPAYEFQSGTYFARLGHEGEGSSAQGWSISMSSERGTITSITTEGTIADMVENGGLFSDGFNKTQVVDPAKNFGASGAVSAVVLSLTQGTTLPGHASNRIAKIAFEAKVPAGGGSAKLLYVDGLVGSGQKVNNVITQDGVSRDPVRNPLSIDLIEFTGCCNAGVNVGFSEVRLKRGTGFSGILDDTENCSADGSFDVEVPEHERRSVTAYANVISNLNPARAEGVQGWSFSILLTGDKVDIVSCTTARTSADVRENGGWTHYGFQKTGVIDPAKNMGKRGGVSGVVLSLTEGTTLPFVGTESVLEIGLTSKEPQTDEAQVGTLAFVSGLRLEGQPVNNVVTVGGDSKLACNFATASVDVRFIKRPPAGEFIRGNSNDDAAIDIADPIWTISELFRGGPAATCADAADANDDGIVDASDAVYMIEYLFRSGPSPVGPFPDCGADPTDDTGDENPLNDLLCERESAPGSCP